MATLFINNVDIKDHNCHLLSGYTIGGTEITNDLLQGRNRTSFNLISQEIGMKEIEFEIEFEGTRRNEVKRHKSAVDALMLGNVDFFFPNGFHYDSVVTSIGELSLEGVEDRYLVGKVTYKAQGFEHDDLVTHVGNKIRCVSTIPKTDCILECTASKAYETLQIEGVTLTGVKKGDKIKIDGKNGRILINGGPAAGNFTFTNFPYLVPEVNNLTCDETLTISYYPTYI